MHLKMASGRNQRFDSTKSSSYSSTASVVVVVALCLLGVWMITLSNVVPEDLSSSGKSEVTDEVSETVAKPFEDTQSIAETTDTKSTSEAIQDHTGSRNSEKSSDLTKGDKYDSVNTAKQTYSDESGTGEGGEVAKTVEDMAIGDGGTDSTVESDRQGSSSEHNTNEDRSSKQGRGESSEKKNNSEQSSTEIVGNDQLLPNNNKNSSESQLQQSGTADNAEETAGDEQQSEGEKNSSEISSGEQQQSDGMKNSEQVEKSDGYTLEAEKDEESTKENAGRNQDIDSEKSAADNKTDGQPKDQTDVAQPYHLNETSTQNAAWSTQAAESKNEKEVQASLKQYSWKLCNVTSGADYIPCLDNEEAIKKLRTTKHYEHRERHCPEEGPTCLVPLPKEYRKSIEWPTSRDKIWYYNVPHTQLAVVKGHQNWVKVSGEYLAFPGGGTQFKNGALHYIDFIQESMPDIAWGKQSRVVLDVGCGVASFGGYLFDRDTITMSFAPKDEHEAQVQFALERGIPAISAVMGTKRLPYPSNIFDVIHCARCRVPWHIEGGMLLLELNRLLRPGGYFVWSATPVYQKLQEDLEIWNAMSALTKSMCWELVAKRRDALNEVGLAIFRKPSNNTCYEKRKQNKPPICEESDDPNAAWNIRLQACIHKLPVDSAARGSYWPDEWPQRLEKTPYWLNSMPIGVYGNPAPKDFQEDYKHWKNVVSNSYADGMGINWSNIRNVMDMRSVYGGFAAALRDKAVWVMNVVSINSPDTLPVIYERGLFGIYHDWCESFSSYPRTYDLLHADHLFSMIKKRCKIVPVFVEVDRLLRPEGKLIVWDTEEIIEELEKMAKSLNWEITRTSVKEGGGPICFQKTMWRPNESETSTSSMS